MKRNSNSSGSLVQPGGSSSWGGTFPRAGTLPWGVLRTDPPRPPQLGRMYSECPGVADAPVPVGWYEEWKSIQEAIVSLFDGNTLSADEINELCAKTRTIVNSEMGVFMYDYYKNNILPRGMSVMLEKLDKSTDECVIASLERAWLLFYHHIIHILQVVMKPVRHPSDKTTCRRIAGLAFRDHVLLQSGLEGIMLEQRYQAGATIQQMLLVLMLVKEEGRPSENYQRLETLTACAVTPFLGHAGLFIDSKLVVSIPMSQVQTPDSVSNRPPFSSPLDSFSTRTTHASSLDSFSTRTSYASPLDSFSNRPPFASALGAATLKTRLPPRRQLTGSEYSLENVLEKVDEVFLSPQHQEHARMPTTETPRPTT